MDLKLECQYCGTSFILASDTYARMGLKDLPSKCPTCKDVGKALVTSSPRIGTVVERRCIGFWPCIVVQSAIAGRLEPTDTQRARVGRAVIQGKDFGETVWHGRLDIWDHRSGAGTFPQEWASARFMVAEKVVGVTDRGSQVWSPTHDWAPEVVRHRISSYRYLVLGEPRGGPEPESEPEPSGALVYVSRRSKYTLKGFGRQVGSRFHISEGCTEIARVGARVRSGRIEHEGVVAIVPEGDYVAVESWSDQSPSSWLLWGHELEGRPVDILPDMVEQT